MTDKISLQMARNVMLAAQGLDQSPHQPVLKADVLEAVRRMCLLQIDTINVVARSPYLVLWSRLGDYQPEWLDELLAEGSLFEYWAHAMCFIPIEDYPFYRRLMVDAIQMEPGVVVNEKLVADLAAVLLRLADWHGTPDLVVRQSDPPELAARLEAAR